MSWFDDLWRVVAPVLPSAINAGARLYGANQAANANTDAARLSAEAALRGSQLQANATQRGIDTNAQLQREGRAETRAAAGRGIEAIRAGTQDFARTTAPMLTERPIMLPSYRGLTDAQQIARDDLRRNGLATIAASGLRGSGAGVRSVMDQDRRFVADAAARGDADRLGAMRSARASADSARQNLGQVYAQQGSAIANTEIGAGNSIANNLSNEGRSTAGMLASQGNAQAQGMQMAADTQAQAGVANAGVWGDTLGAIGSIVAGSFKDEAMRGDRYRASGRTR